MKLDKHHERQLEMDVQAKARARPPRSSKGENGGSRGATKRKKKQIGADNAAALFPDTRPVPKLIQGDARDVLSKMAKASVDMAITSPPYWGHRQYDEHGIGLEPTPEEYIQNLLAITAELHRVLKSTGSFWLNIGDTYRGKNLLGVPWRVALSMTDQQGWILRNDVVWHKVKGAPDNSKDKLRNVHEYVFHFVKSKNYFYDVDAIRSNPKSAKVVRGAVISATGVSGVRYRRQIELSTHLTPREKHAALTALEAMLAEIQAGRIADFRMIIRGQQRTTHSDQEKVSGRAKELRDKGFYFLRYHPKGSKPSDVWDIIPEDTQGRESHFAPYPADLCRLPIVATCPPGGVVLDPFCGTGTSLIVARNLGRESVGIDISKSYIDLAAKRIKADT
jgi:DNA modification methylase